MTEVKSYVCPNCGANTTNTQNCDYCGSLLVRFVERDIDLSGTAYLNNDNVLPGLIKHLEQNLTLQKNSKNSVVTDIRWISKQTWDTICILQNKNCVWLDDTKIMINEEDGMVISLCFTTTTETGYEYFNYRNKRREERFKALPSFKLFTQHITFSGDDKISEYAIFFGKDVEGAARIISEILVEVMNVPLNDNTITIDTNTFDIIQQNRVSFNQFAQKKIVEDEKLRKLAGKAKKAKRKSERKSESANNSSEILGVKWYWWVLLVVWLWICFS